MSTIIRQNKIVDLTGLTGDDNAKAAYITLKFTEAIRTLYRQFSNSSIMTESVRVKYQLATSLLYTLITNYKEQFKPSEYGGLVISYNTLITASDNFSSGNYSQGIIQLKTVYLNFKFK